MTRIIALSASLGLMAAYGIAFAAPGGAAGKPPVPPAPKATATEDTSVTGALAAQADDFSFDDVSKPEKAVGNKSTSTREQSVDMKRLAAVPVGKSWLEPIEIPATITDETEKKTFLKEAGKKIQNRLTGSVRRHKKQDGNGSHNFSVLLVNDPERGVGVRVYRNEDVTPEASPEVATA